MVTSFNKKDLISFGNYLLSKERKEKFLNHPERDSMPLLEDSLSQVHHSDLENWKLESEAINKWKALKLITTLETRLRLEGIATSDLQEDYLEVMELLSD